LSFADTCQIHRAQCQGLVLISNASSLTPVFSPEGLREGGGGGWWIPYISSEGDELLDSFCVSVQSSALESSGVALVGIVEVCVCATLDSPLHSSEVTALGGGPQLLLHDGSVHIYRNDVVNQSVMLWTRGSPLPFVIPKGVLKSRQNSVDRGESHRRRIPFPRRGRGDRTSRPAYSSRSPWTWRHADPRYAGGRRAKVWDGPRTVTRVTEPEAGHMSWWWSQTPGRVRGGY